MIQSPLKKKIKNRAAKNRLAPFYWRAAGGERLISNDYGFHAWLDEAAFKRFAAGKLGARDKAFAELSSKGFIGGALDFNELSAKWRARNSHLYSGPGLHILVMTTRCNHRCLYCQSGAVAPSSEGADMSWPTAKKSVDVAFQTTARGLTIEFQGGEPLLNWEVVKKVAAYARKKEKESGKRLVLALVTNFSLMTEEKARFLLAREVSICTSLDGPAGLHNKNRVFCRGNSHSLSVKWIKYFTARAAVQGPGYRVFKPSALLTVTKFSLGRAEEIINEYSRLGLEDIFIRPLSPIGYAKSNWGAIGYTAEEFVDFYKRSLEHILKLNRAGTVIREKMAAMLLEKIVAFKDPGYLDVRCPCGAATGQIAYDCRGDMYTCDEGRMVAWAGDEIFKIGNVFRDAYGKAVACPTARACLAASELHAQPECSRCVYSPYCGVCPVYNYEAQGSLWGSMPSNERCQLMKGIFGLLFSKLRNRKDGEILRKWVKK